MTYYGAKELAASFRTVRKNTLQIAEEIPESQYGFSAAPGTRTVEKMLTHIAFASRLAYRIHGVEKRNNFDGFDFPGFMQTMLSDEATPRSKAQVLELLKTEGEKWATFVDGLPEAFLAESFAMTPGAIPASKSRLEMIGSVKEHEMHHRGQLMLIQRAIGIVPHLTREFQERMAQFQTQANSAKK